MFPLYFRPNGATGGEVIDPYVSVRLHGHESDVHKGTQFNTEVVNNNGFNPVWKNARTTFTILVPELAMLEIKVKDQDHGQPNEHIGSFASPVKYLKNGK